MPGRELLHGRIVFVPVTLMVLLCSVLQSNDRTDWIIRVACALSGDW